MDMVGKVGNRPSNVRFVWEIPIYIFRQYIVGKVYADMSNRSEITENITQANELGGEVVERFQTKG